MISNKNIYIPVHNDGSGNVLFSPVEAFDNIKGCVDFIYKEIKSFQEATGVDDYCTFADNYSILCIRLDESVDCLGRHYIDSMTYLTQF